MKHYFVERVLESNEAFYVYNQSDDNKKVYLNSNFSSEKEAEKFIKQLKSDELNIIIGIGNGAVVKQLQKVNFLHCLFIEPYNEVEIDEEIKAIISRNQNLTFYYYNDMSALIINEYIKKFLGLKANLLIHPRYEKTNVEYINDILQMIKNGLVMLQVNKNTENYFKKDWIIEPLLNLKYTISATSIAEYKDKFKGETAFLVASGPSMKENIPLIKDMKDKAFIFSVGSALNGLLTNNIVPDFVTVIDSSIKNYTAHFQGVNYDGPLIISGMVNSNIVKNHDGPTILANLNIDAVTPYFRENDPSFPAVPSVAVFTLQILYYLGFSTVYLIGQDLALVNGEYYAEGVTVHQGSNKFDSQLLVESNNGLKVGTIYSLFSHLQSFNELIKLFDKDKMQLFNLSKKGAKIKGVDYVDAEEVRIQKGKIPLEFHANLFEDMDDNIDKIKEFVLKISSVKEEVDGILSKLKKLNMKSVTLKDLKKVLKLFKLLREQNIIEEIFLNQLSFFVQRLNNKFEYTFEKDIITNQDRIEMVNDIIKLTQEIQSYVDDVLCDERISIFLNKE